MAGLIDLIEIADAGLGPLPFGVAVLQQVQDDGLDILANIAWFSKPHCIGDSEGTVERVSRGVRQSRLAGSCRADCCAPLKIVDSGLVSWMRETQ